MTLAAILDAKITFASRAFFVGRFRYQERLSRLTRGLAYAFGRSLTEDDRHVLRTEMNEALGYYPLMTLAAEDLLHEARSRYGEQAGKLTPYFAAACDRVAGKWDNCSDAFGFAVDWALEQAVEYASHDGIHLAEDN